MMETFQDIADPTCVRLVNPADLAASFVTGVRLKSVTLEVTDEAVTEGRVQGGCRGGCPANRRHRSFPSLIRWTLALAPLSGRATSFENRSDTVKRNCAVQRCAVAHPAVTHRARPTISAERVSGGRGL